MGLQKFLIGLSAGGIGEVVIDSTDAFPRNDLILQLTHINKSDPPVEQMSPIKEDFLKKHLSSDNKLINLSFIELTKVIPSQTPGIFWKWMREQGIKKIRIADLGSKPFEGLSEGDLTALGIIQEERIGSDVLYRLETPR